MTPTAKTTAQRFYSAALILFAVVGFFASIATITDAFDTDGPNLSAKVYASRMKFPYYFYAAAGSGFEENGRTFINTLRTFCNEKPLPRTLTEPKANGNDSDPTSGHACKHIADLQLASDQITETFESSGTTFDIELENRGQTKATGIRLAGTSILFADVFAGGRHVRAPWNAERGSYDIPDINPGESVRIEVWKKGSSYNYESLYDFEVPEISYNGPRVDVQTFAYTPTLYYELYDFLRFLGPVVATLLVILVATFIGMPVIILLAMAEALMKGRPVLSVFKSAEAASTPTPTPTEN